MLHPSWVTVARASGRRWLPRAALRTARPIRLGIVGETGYSIITLPVRLRRRSFAHVPTVPVVGPLGGWSPWVGPLGWVGLTCRMERCSEHANENGTNKRKGTEEEWKVNTKDYCRVLPGHLAGKVVRRGPDKSKSSFCRAVASLPRPRRHDGVFVMVHRPALR